MNLINNFINESNLITTLTINNSKELATYPNEKIDKIDFSTSINLQEFIKIFNDLYLEFQKDYQKTDKIYLGKKIKSIRYFENKRTKSRNLMMRIEEPNKELCEKKEMVLNIREEKGIIKNYDLSNSFFPEESNLSLDEKILKQYLDLFQKNKQFINTYNYHKNQVIICLGNLLMASIINDNSESLSLSLILKSTDILSQTYINITFKLSENLEIDYDASEVKIYGVTYENKKEVIDKLIQEIYINRNLLPEIYRDYDNEKTSILVRRRIPHKQ